MAGRAGGVGGKDNGGKESRAVRTRRRAGMAKCGRVGPRNVEEGGEGARR